MMIPSAHLYKNFIEQKKPRSQDESYLHHCLLQYHFRQQTGFSQEHGQDFVCVVLRMKSLTVKLYSNHSEQPGKPND